MCEWSRTLDGASGLVNLVGRRVDCVKTPDHQDEIIRSRIEATLALGLAIRNVESPSPVWVQMSTAHILRRSTAGRLHGRISIWLWPGAIRGVRLGK